MEPQRPIGMIGGYYWNNQWFLTPRQIWKGLPRITHLRCSLIHGRFKVASMPRTSGDLDRASFASELHLDERTGHTTSKPQIVPRYSGG